MSDTTSPRPRSAAWLTLPSLLLFIVMLLTPLSLTLMLSFNEYDAARGATGGFTLSHYAAIVSDGYYLEIFLRTLRIGLITTLLCVAIGVPEAYILSRMAAPWRSVFLMIVLTPLLVSVVVRTFGWSMLLGIEGPVNMLFQAIGIGKTRMLYTEGAVITALVHVMLPFMVIPVWTALQKLDPQVEQAALSFGASRLTAIVRVVLPQIMPGILSGGLIVFGLAASSFAIPGLLGGRRLKMVATTVYDQYLHELNWPMGAAIAVILLIANLIVMLTCHRVVERQYRRRLG